MGSALRRVLSAGAILLGLAGLVAGAVILAVGEDSSSQPEIQISPPFADLGSVVSKSSYPLRFSLQNVSDRTITVMGVSSWCSKKGCIVAERQSPVSVAPGGTFQVDATFVAGETGPFSCRFYLYTDSPPQTAIGLMVKGVTIQATDFEPKSESMAKSG